MGTSNYRQSTDSSVPEGMPQSLSTCPHKDRPTWHDPVEVAIFHLLIEVVLCHVEGAAGFLPLQEAHIPRPCQPLQQDATS